LVVWGLRFGFENSEFSRLWLGLIEGGEAVSMSSLGFMVHGLGFSVHLSAGALIEGGEAVSMNHVGIGG